MSFSTWLHSVADFFAPEEAAIAAYLTPLVNDIKTQAIAIGKGDLAVGFKILGDAALAAATAGLTAVPGTNVAVAEAAFLSTLVAEGIPAVHNAEAALIKAAVAILAGQGLKANTTPVAVVANTAPVVTSLNCNFLKEG